MDWIKWEGKGLDWIEWEGKGLDWIEWEEMGWDLDGKGKRKRVWRETKDKREIRGAMGCGTGVEMGRDVRKGKRGQEK